MSVFGNILGGIGGGAATTIGGGLISSLFGRRSSNPYAAQQAQALSNLSSDRGALSGLGATAGANLARWNPQAQAANQGLYDYLGQDPFTSQEDTSFLADASRGAAQAYNAARAHLNATNNAGIPGGSMAAGQNVALEAALAGNRADAANQLANRKIATRFSNLSQRAALADSLRQGAFQNAQGVIGAQAGIDQTLAGAYGGLSNDIYSRDAAYNGALASTFGNAAGSIANLLAMRQARQPQPLPSFYDDPLAGTASQPYVSDYQPGSQGFAYEGPRGSEMGSQPGMPASYYNQPYYSPALTAMNPRRTLPGGYRFLLPGQQPVAVTPRYR